MCYGWNIGQEVAVMGYWLELQLDIHFDTKQNQNTNNKSHLNTTSFLSCPPQIDNNSFSQ
jgi:hypothetical protein